MPREYNKYWVRTLSRSEMKRVFVGDALRDGDDPELVRIAIDNGFALRNCTPAEVMDDPLKDEVPFDF